MALFLKNNEIVPQPAQPRGFQPNGWKNRLRSGQVAVIMIVTIAIGLVLFAASINLTMMSQVKTYTMKAASSSSSLMASTIASYGQKQFVETMGGRKEYCKKSHGGLIAIIVLIILIVIAVYTGYYCTECVAGTWGGAIAVGSAVAAVMQGASILISASTDPGISEAWNQMMADNLSTTGQFVERGVLVGLQGAVTDAGKIPDLYDQDGDGIYGYIGNDSSKWGNDEISRFAHNITRRYLDMAGPDTTAVNTFLNDLHELVIVPGGDNFAIVDPVYYPDENTKNVEGAPHSATHLCYQPYFQPAPPAAPGTLNPAYNQRPAECDPCCLQTEGTIEGCDASAGGEQIGSRAICPMRTPFRADVGTTYQYIYDPSYEDSTNAFMSLREQLGRDDEHKKYHTVEAVPNWHGDPVGDPQVLHVAPPPEDFVLKDVVGYYRAPAFANNDEWISSALPPVGNKPALFPFLYKMRDWAPDISTATYANYACHWCDPNKPADPGKTCPADISPEIAPVGGRLALPRDPATTYNNNQGWCVGNVNKGGIDDPPIVSDRVKGIPDLFLPATACGLPDQIPEGDISQYIGAWKAGADRYCSNAPGTSYDLYCPKVGGPATATPELTCVGMADASAWPDDMLDEIIYTDMPLLFDFERSLWQSRANGGLAQLTQELPTWYGEVAPGAKRANDGIADWIEPACLDVTNCPGSYTKLPRPGRLHVWREQFRAARQLLQEWIIPPGDVAKPKYVNESCFGNASSWCVQASTCNGSLIAAEEATFDANGNGQRGDLPDVISCLNWNANDPFIAWNGVPRSGNAAKFQNCWDQCNFTNCSQLPRSLIPNYYTFLPLEFYPGDEALFNACLASVDINTCNTACNNATLPSGAPYVIPPFNAPEMDRIVDIDDWCGNPVTSGNPLLNACNGATMPGGVTTLNCATNMTPCRCSWADDCLLSNECGNSTCLTAGSYCDAVTQALPVSRGSCGNAQQLLFMSALNLSAVEAENQVAKFRKRHDFLKGRYEEAQSIIDTLTIAIDRLTAFLDNGTPNNFNDSPAERFIQYRLAPIQNTTKDLPSFAIYVWQDKDATKTNLAGQPRSGTGQGYWHAVKSEVRLPRRCAGNCLSNDWPKVDSKTSGGFLSKKVCYKLINLEGITKSRVIRYDQDKDLTGLMFPSGGQIWNSRMSNPNAAGAANPGGIRVTCANFIDADLTTWLAAGPADEKSSIGAAFMLNRIPGAGAPLGYNDCWNAVHDLMLAHGVMSESCAQYYFVDGVGFRTKFVPCDNW